jgi:hypothetical protein
LWVTAQALDHWAALPRSTPGGQCFYSDLAIETSLMLRLIFRQPLRQTEGLMASIFALLGVDLKAPDHSTMSRRAMNLKSISKKCMVPNGPIHILIDSTRLKVFGAGESLLEKHGKTSMTRPRWGHCLTKSNRKLFKSLLMARMTECRPTRPLRNVTH